MINEERITELLQGYVSNSLSETELVEMLDRLKEDKGDKALENFMNNQFIEAKNKVEILPVDWKKILDNIHRKKQISPVRNIFWLRIAAAVIVGIILSIASFLFFNNKPERQFASTETHKQQIKNDAAPGGYKAVLILADGSQIILDSANNGTLTRQGNTKIIKLSNGELTYSELNEKPQVVLYNSIKTPKGGQYQIVLTDGSKVWLNAASSLRFPTTFPDKERNVEISGEAYLEVTKIAAKPFYVTVNHVKVQVLGTHFNVNGYDDEAEVKTTLLEGSVKVTTAEATNLLKPGQQAQVTKNGDIKVIIADVDQAVAWKEGFFSLKKTDMQSFIRMVSRWYDVDVVYEGEVPTGTISGKAQRSLSFSQMQEVLQLNDVKFRIDGKRMIVTK